MVKVRKEISVDTEVEKAVADDTENSGFCLSRYVNAHLKERYRLKRVQTD
jgi:hypothetical protein